MARKAAKKAKTESLNGQGVTPKLGQWPADRVIRKAVDELIPYARNPRMHTPEQVDSLAEGIRRFGFTNPVIIDHTGEIIAGHGRIMASRRLGLTEVPTVMIADGEWSEDDKRAYRIFDNSSALMSEWDPALLKVELTDLKLADYDLKLTGFDSASLVSFMAFGGAGGRSDPEATPEPPTEPVSRPGDLWVMGSHRLLCGDARNADDVTRLLGGITPDLANCDPPYGISIVKSATVGGAKPFTGKSQGHVHAPGPDGFKKLGRVHGPARRAIIQPGIYAPVTGDDTTDTAIAAYETLRDLKIPVIVLWGGNYYANALPPSRCWLVWDKETTGTFADVELAWTNQDRVAELFRHQWNGLMKASERGERRVHPTQKPVKLASWVIEKMAPKAQSVLDFFVGSGSGLIAAHVAGKQFFGMEIESIYVDVTVMRWRMQFGGDAILEATGQTFEQVREERTGAVSGTGTRQSGRASRSGRSDTSGISSIPERPGASV